MTFLNPAMLWGLAAISIPIIIHIFNLKRTKKIEFSTLMFLKEIQQSKYKKIKLKQLLILLCRIAFVIMLVLMFSRPFDKGYLGQGENARSSVLIILDDSFSMQARDVSGNNLDNAKTKINEMLGILNENDEIFFTTVSEINRLERNILYKNTAQLKDTLNNIKTSDITKNLNEVLFFAREILKSSSNSYKEVYLFTDGQKSFIENENIIGNEFKTDEQTKINLVLIGSRTPNNLSVDTVNTVTKIFEKNKSVKIKAVLNNHNNFNVTNKSLIINYGSYKDEKVIDIPANSSVDVGFSFNPAVTGYSGGNIELIQNEISDDEISGDNKQFFAFYVPKTISLLLVSGSVADLDYINLALSSSEELMRDSLGNKTKYFNAKQVSSNELSSQNLGSFEAVVIVNKPQFTNDESGKIKEYIENGGGVIIYPGSSSSVENYNNVLLKELNLPYINSSFGNDNNSYKFDKIDFEHPIFEGIFKQGATGKNLNIESPEIKSGLNLSAGGNSISLMTLSSEKNFLVEYSAGKGRLLMFAVSPDMKNSDYPAKNMFSPVTVRSILYLANINNIKQAVTGKDYFVDLNSFRGLEDTISISRSAAQNENKIAISSKQSLINLGSILENTSIYNIKSGGNIIYEFPCSFNRIESQTTKLSDKEISGYLREKLNLEANIIKPQEIVSASVLELRAGKEIWHYFLVLALIFLAVEYFIARSITKNK